MKRRDLVLGLVVFSILSSVWPLGVFAVPTVVDLDDPSTFGSAVVYEGGKYYINGDVTLVEETYVNKRLVVNASGITLDGGGATLFGLHIGAAVTILEKRDVVVRDLFVTNYDYGIARAPTPPWTTSTRTASSSSAAHPPPPYSPSQTTTSTGSAPTTTSREGSWPG